jgi:hypothetical protein
MKWISAAVLFVALALANEVVLISRISTVEAKYAELELNQGKILDVCKKNTQAIDNNTDSIENLTAVSRDNLEMIKMLAKR